jgi:hypothetical protein
MGSVVGFGGVGTVEPVGKGRTGFRGETADRGPRVCGLSSARDRARLREREAAERARVEQVLARGPIGRELEDEGAVRSRRQAVAPCAPACICQVCGGSDIAVDVVRDRGTWRLARCARCDFIWTERARSSWGEPRVIGCRDASAA